MAAFPTTLGGLKTRIITETNRDDLTDELASALDTVINDSIEFYATERWWWNEARVTSTTTPDNEYIDRPAAARIIDQPFLLIGGVRYDMSKRSMEWIEGMYTTPLKGQPTDYCEFGTQCRLWPMPNQAWTIIWLDIADLSALASDNASNYWTTACPQLISARSRMIFFRDYFKSDADYARAEVAERQWYGHFKGESNRRIGTGFVRPSP